MSKLQPVRGTHDLFGKEAQQFSELVALVRSVGQLYGFQDTSTPIFEFTEVFKRTLGDTSDVVSKEMYSFDDRGSESLTLRPEFTAGIARAFISNGWQQHLPLKLFSTGPLFRYERPQKGRQRQFHQVNFEYLGDASPYADIEMILLGAHILSYLQILPKCKLEINTLGDKESRAAYTKALVDYFTSHHATLSEDSKTRLAKNPLRILDSKDAGDKELVKNAPTIQEYLTPAAKQFMDTVIAGLKDSPVANVLTINPAIVRGLDYYSHTVFEFTAYSEEIGAQNTVLAGGRYDGLIEQMGGTPTPAVGFAAGIERLLLLAPKTTFRIKPIAVIALGDSAIADAFKLTQALRSRERIAEMVVHNNAGKALKKADKIHTGYAVLLGENELATGQYVVKDLTTGTQEAIAKEAIISYLLATKEESYEV